MGIYKHIFFDLDHTLWDFEKNCAKTLQELFVSYELDQHKIEVENFIEKYTLVNNRMWHEYNRGSITKEDIRNSRFELTFKELGLEKVSVPTSMNEDFLNTCPTKGILFPHVHEVLTYLNDKYSLHIITNGFKETQHIKISTSNLDKYFTEIINSELCGYLKPDKRVFDYAVNKVNAACTDCIMIGDNMYTDILGAKNAGLDQIFFNPNEIEHKEEITHEIKSLNELMNIL
jgi:putative hydrolase of the HAD superfamily